MIKKGSHKTQCGLRAVVAQSWLIDSSHWIFRGAVVAEDEVLHLHVWSLSGISLLGVQEYNLNLDEAV